MKSRLKMRRMKKIILILIVGLLCIIFLASPALAQQAGTSTSGRETKTVEYFLGAYATGDETLLASGAVWTATEGTTIYLPENDINVRSAWLEFNAYTGSLTALSAIQIIFNGATYDPVTSTYFAGTVETHSVWALADVTDAFASFSNPMTANATVTVTGPTTGGHGLKLYITYDYDSNSSTELVNTVKFPINSSLDIVDDVTAHTATYNATIAEATSSIRAAWFEISGFSDGINKNDAKIQAKINSDSFSTYQHIEENTQSPFDIRYYMNTSGTSFALNTEQNLTINSADVSGSDLRAVGGELAVTYNYSSSETTRTKTIGYFMGQGTTRDLTTQTTFSRTIKLPESNVVVKNIWAKVSGGHASTTLGTLTIDSSVDGNAGPTNAYSLDSILAAGYQPITYDMSSLAGFLTDGSEVNVSYQYSVNVNMPAGIELFITYQYSPFISPDQIKTVKYFGGQSVSALAKTQTFTPATYILEENTALQSGYLQIAHTDADVSDPTLTTTINSSSSTAVQIETAIQEFYKTLNGDPNNMLTATNNSYSLGMSSATNLGGNVMIDLTYNYSAVSIVHVTNISQPTALETNISFGGSTNNQFTAECTVDVQGAQSSGVYLILEENSTGSWVEVPTSPAATDPIKANESAAFSCGTVDPAVDCSHSWTVSGNDINQTSLRCRSNSTESVGDNSLNERIPVVNVKGGTFTFTEIYPTANVDEGLEEIQTLNATVTCNDFYCGMVNLTWMTNDNGDIPNTNISGLTDITNYTISSIKSDCGALDVGDNCSFGLPVNLTLDASVDNTPANRQVHLNVTPAEDEMSSMSSPNRNITIHTGKLNVTLIAPNQGDIFVLQVANYADAIQANITCLNYNCRNVQAVAYYDPAGGAEADTLIPTDESGKLQVLNPSSNTWESPNTECSSINEGESCILDWDLDAIVVQAGMAIEVQANSTYWNETILNQTVNPDPQVDSVSQTLTTNMTATPPATSDKTDTFTVTCRLDCDSYQCVDAYVELWYSDNDGTDWYDMPNESSTSVFLTNASNTSLGTIAAGSDASSQFNITANRADNEGQIRCRGWDEISGGGTEQEANSTAAASDVTVGSLSIVYQFPTSNMNISLHNTTTVNATVSCTGGYCGNISAAYWKTNNSVNSPNMSIAACSETTTDICFLAGEANPKTDCDILDSTGGTANCSFPLQVNFTMDASDETIIEGGRIRQIEMNTTATDPDVSDPTVSGFNFTIRTGAVSIILNKPISDDIIVKGTQSNNFFNATITCNNFNCRDLNYSVRYADSGTEATTDAPNASDGDGGSRFFVTLSADNTCSASLDAGQSCYAIWHATGDSAEIAFPYNDRPVDVNVTSTHADTGSNASSSDPLIDILRLGFEGYITDDYNGLSLDSTQVTVFNLSNDAQIAQTTSNGSGYYFAEVGSSGTYYLVLKRTAYITETKDNSSQGYVITNTPYQLNVTMSTRGYTFEAATYASWYKINKNVIIKTFLTDSRGLGVTGATCYVKNIWNENLITVISNVAMTEVGDGAYIYNTTATNLTGIEGTYFGVSNCTLGAIMKDTIFSYNVWDVAAPGEGGDSGGGTGASSVSVSSEENYDRGETAIVSASVRNSTGALVTPTWINITITHRITNNSVVNSTEMISSGNTGFYYYNWTIPSGASCGGYEVIVRASISGTITGDSSTFVVSCWISDINNSLNYIRDKIDNTIIPYLNEINSTTHTTYSYLTDNIKPQLNGMATNISYIRDNMATSSALSSMQTDVTWLVDNVATQINITTIISKIDVIDTNVDELIIRTDCSNSSKNNLSSQNNSLCSYLYTINSTVDYIKNNMATQENISTILSDTNWLVSNVATQENITETLNRLTTINNTVNTISSDLLNINSSLQTKIDNIQNNVTWLIDNVATQENITEIITRLTEINTTTSEIDSYLDGEITTRLTEINTTTQDTNSYLKNEITTRLTELNTTAQNVYTDTQALIAKWGTYTAQQLYNISNETYYKTIDIYNDMATSASITTLQTDISWIKNSTATQANITEIYNRLSGIDNNLTNIRTTLDCSNPANSDLCTYIEDINTTVNYIKANMATASALSNLQTDVTWLVDNVATQINITTIISKIDVIDTNVDELIIRTDCSNSSKNNLSSQNNSLCSYLYTINSTVDYIKNNMATATAMTDVQNNVTWLYNNVATQQALDNNFTDVRSRLSDMNVTLQNIEHNLTAINTSLSNQIADVQNNVTWLYNNVATSVGMDNNFTETFNRLSQINSTTQNISTHLDGEITTRLTELNTTTQDTNSYLKGTIISRFDSVDGNLTEIDNYLQDIIYTKLNETWNNTQQTLTYIGAPSDDENQNTLFGEHAYTQNRLFEINGNLTYLKTLTERINITIDTINSTVSTILLEVDDLEELHQCSINPNSTICTLLNNIYTDTQNIYDLSLVINQTTSSMNLFSISALVAGSPRYANEEALIEATFTTQNGSFVEPDTINITIYDKNDNRWANATKSDFTEGSDNIWQYSKSIEANPTTGMYTVHMVASYNGVEASKSAQFRIATGGPYKVYLECPSSSYVGQNLNCNVILQDEGEAPTESTSIVWVDTNNDGTWDAGEPQTSFSKQTVPLQNVTQSVSINVPSSHPLGLYVIRVDTSYASSSQPNSGASDSVTFSTAPSAAPGAEGGGGRGGGIGVAPIVPPITGEVVKEEGKIQILEYPENIKLKVGETITKQVIIRNSGNDTLHNVQLLISGLPLEFYSVNPKTIDIEAGETKTFIIEFTPSKEIRQYMFKFIISSDEETKEVSSILSVEEVIPEEEEAKVEMPSPIRVPSYWLWILIILIVLAGTIYLATKKKELIKELFKKKYKAKKEITPYEHPSLNAKNIIIAVLAVIVLASILFNISIKEIPSKIISVLSAIKLPTISFNWQFVLGALIVLFLACIFIVLIHILKELKKHTHIHKSRITRGSGFETMNPVKSSFEKETSKRKNEPPIPKIMIVKEETKPEPEKTKKQEVKNKEISETKKVFEYTKSREEPKIIEKPAEKKTETKSLHQDKQNLQSAGFNVKPTVRKRLEKIQDLDKPSFDETRTKVYKMIEEHGIDVGNSLVQQKVTQPKTEQIKPEIQAKIISAPINKQVIINQLKEVYK